ncbi:MAG: integrase [Firmicutes bacterium HGW-Firmicutes-14]|nr:MAG: integrase [Firmicutes bacterium HGW-Firmicutes-14]
MPSRKGVHYMKQEERETLANFRFSLIAPLVTRELVKGERQKILTELACQSHLTPTGECKTFSIRTLERYVAAYEKEGLAGLVPKVRNDAAHCRVTPPDLLEKAVALKLETPDRSVRQIIRILELTNTCPEGFLKPSTLSNHLYEAEPVQKLVEGNKESCRRYEMAYRNQVWQADTQHTLYLPHPKQPNKRRLAYLIIFLDDYSRLVTHGEFFFEENILSLEQVFKKAILKHGIPEKLYVDNGAIYSSRHLQGICARLKTHLIHAKPYRPQGKGKVERFFHYVDRSFKPEAYLLIEQGKLTTLDDLNQFFWAWLEKAYQTRVHGTTKEKPRIRFARCDKELRYLDPVLLDKYFLWEETRNVSIPKI